MIRAGSRLSRAAHIPYETKHQLIIPKDHPLTTVLIRTTHQKLLHAGPQHIQAHLQQRFKIVRGTNLVRKVARDCVNCRRKRARPTEQLMAPLPDYRFPQHRTDPFAATALDAAGPFFIKEGKAEEKRKAYFVLFTCLVYRAVHVEPLFTMSASSFLQAFDRFASRRGIPSRVVSDNGTNFTAAAAELKQLWKKEAKAHYQQERPMVQWDFLPPYAPHFGGAHERMVGATKTALYHTFKPSSAVSLEEYLTALTVVEGILNSRPLTYVTADEDSQVPLTPADFLNTRPYRVSATLPQGAGKQTAWRRLQERLDHFWGRFVKEMQPHLQKMTKWRLRGRDFREGDVVVFLENNNRGVWPLGRVTGVISSSDGVVRKLRVLSGGSVHERAVERVMLLLPEEGESKADLEVGRGH